jgi:hypothetical protein
MLIGPSLILYWVVVVGTITPLAIRLLVPFRVSSETNGSAVIVLGTESAEVEIAFSSRTTQVLPQFLPAVAKKAWRFTATIRSVVCTAH